MKGGKISLFHFFKQRNELEMCYTNTITFIRDRLFEAKHAKQ
jgi:hypothetical protein